ncbi:hypothetical protein XENOCAPTIV_002610 [Xenoophorus captivus]|uniref:Poly (ADP-ribose) polymerase family, member 12b n=1 Tax=Xenoophorus captivus TaxID=1517983 RepID=A0ABV0RN97_9TELE
MSSISSVIHQATSCLCDSRGSMHLQQLQQHLQERCRLSDGDFIYIIQGCPQRFLLVPEGNSYTVVGRTSLRLCRTYSRGDRCEGSCQQLHLCKFYVFGNCRFGKGRKLCKLSHDVHSAHNFALLRECTLHELKDNELFLLLLQNDPQLLPEVCFHYNKGSAPHGCCSFQDSCTKVHLCQHFVQGDCMFGHKCKRQHAIDRHGQRILEERGVLCRVFCVENCRRVHFHLPYKWEVCDGTTWSDLENMEEIEQDYCHPASTRSSDYQQVDFVTMTLESMPVRRLSTVSSVMKPPHYSLTTQWLWYYKGDQGDWVEYGQLDEKQLSTSVTSQTLEEAFLSGKKAEVEVIKGRRVYVVSFKDMYQRNPKHKTKRRVCRRPRFVSKAEVDKLVANPRKCSG